MPQKDLMQTEFFADFLSRDGLRYGVNLFLWDGTQNIGDLRIWRNAKRQNFDLADVQILSIVQPAIAGALIRARGACLEDTHDCTDALPLLSHQEMRVAKLIAAGMSDKSVAVALGIEFSTVRTHISKIFSKLGMNKRTQLVRHMARMSENLPLARREKS